MTGRTLLILEFDDITSVEWKRASVVILSTADSLLVENPGSGYNVHVVTDQGDITEWVTVYPSEGGLFLYSHHARWGWQERPFDH